MPLKIKPISKMHNSLGLLGACWMADAQVIAQWIESNAGYSILKFGYGLSICSHNNTPIPHKDIRTIIKQCSPDIRKYHIERTENITRIIKQGE